MLIIFQAIHKKEALKFSICINSNIKLSKYMFYKGVNKTFWGRVVEIINCTNIRAVIHSIQIQAIEI